MVTGSTVVLPGYTPQFGFLARTTAPGMVQADFTTNVSGNLFPNYHAFTWNDYYVNYAVQANSPDIIDIVYIPDIYNPADNSIFDNGNELVKESFTFEGYRYGILAYGPTEYKVFSTGLWLRLTADEYASRNRWIYLIRDGGIMADVEIPADYDLDNAFRLAGFPNGRPTEQPSGQLQVGSNFQNLIDLFTDDLIHELIANVSTYAYVPVDAQHNHAFDYLFAAEIVEYLAMTGYTVDGRNNLLTGATLGDLSVGFAAPGDMVAQYIRQAAVLRQQAARFGV